MRAKCQRFSVFFHEWKLTMILFSSNFKKKKINAFAFFPVAFPLLFIFASIVFPQIMLVFFLNLLQILSLNWLIKNLCYEQNKNSFFPCFILALLTFGYTNMKRRVHLECMFDLLMEIGPSWPAGVPATLVSAKGNSAKDGLQGESYQCKDRKQIL